MIYILYNKDNHNICLCYLHESDCIEMMNILNDSSDIYDYMCVNAKFLVDFYTRK